MMKKLQQFLLSLLVAAVSLVFAGLLMVYVLFGSGFQTAQVQKESANLAVGDRFRMYVTNQFSSALDGLVEIKKEYWLSDDDLIAPVPDQNNFGTSDDAASLGWLLEEAQYLLDGQDTLFSTETVLAPNTKVNYYLDDTIFSVTWKEAINDTMYTISEVKIQHPSQFRRFLSGGTFGSGIQL